MKIIRQLLAALLLLFFVIACNQDAKKSDARELTVTDIKLMKPEESKPPPSQSLNQQTSVDYQSPKVVTDSEAGIEIVSQDGIKDEGLLPEEAKKEFNTEDYDNIVENKFLTATKN